MKYYLRVKNKTLMESPAFFSILFIGFFVLSLTGYSIYTGFGPAANGLRDPFEEHED